MKGNENFSSYTSMNAKESEAILLSIFNAGPQSVILADVDRKLLLANENAQQEMIQIFKKPLMLGEAIDDYVDPKYQDIYITNFKRALKGEKIKSTTSFTLEDREVWYDVFYMPVINEQNHVHSVCLIFWPITNLKNTEKILLHKLEFVNSISNISTRFVFTEDLDHAINLSLADMGNLSGASRAYIFLYSLDKKMMSNTHEWCAEGVASQIDTLQNIPVSFLPWWNHKLQDKKMIKIKDVSKLPAEASNEREILEQQDIKSLVVFPLYENKTIIGFIGFDNIMNTGEWQENDIELLKVCSEIFSNALQRMFSIKAIEKSEYKYRQLFNNTGDLVFVNEIEENEMPGFFIEVNEIACEKLGYSKIELERKKPIDIMDTEKAPEIWFNFYIKNKIHKFTFEMDLITNKQIRIPCEIHITIFQLLDRKVVISVARDISNRIENEKEMRKLTLAIKNSPSAVIITDENGIIEYVNLKFTEITGYTIDEIKGKHISLINSGVYADEFYKSIWDTLFSGNEWKGEILSKKKMEHSIGRMF